MNRCFCKTKCISSKSCTDQKGPPSFICSFNMFYLQCDMIFSALTDTRSQGFMTSASTKHHLVVGPLFLPTLYPCNCLLLKDLKAMSGQQVRITMAEPMHKNVPLQLEGHTPRTTKCSHYWHFIGDTTCWTSLMAMEREMLSLNHEVILGSD